MDESIVRIALLRKPEGHPQDSTCAPSEWELVFGGCFEVCEKGRRFMLQVPEKASIENRLMAWLPKGEKAPVVNLQGVLDQQGRVR